MSQSRNAEILVPHGPLWLAWLGLPQQGCSALPHSGFGGSTPGKSWVLVVPRGGQGTVCSEALGRGILAWLEAAPAKLNDISCAWGQPLPSHHQGHGPDGAMLQAPGLG